MIDMIEAQVIAALIAENLPGKKIAGAGWIPCPSCGTAIEGIKLGGAGKFFICRGCQVLKKNG